ncbi:EF-hand domain-containing protein [Paramagnetospirillum magneticum]|uniref:EF-hand domain-containing protein n=1 Tax=Paramagnetospirillum magneticum TaxID=84159 RepID=UPI0003154233|nr:EF-hand domain-containing protein [Paramagnetospirillum magneticum]
MNIRRSLLREAVEAALVLAAIGVLVACAGPGRPDPDERPGRMAASIPALLYSPNGEPLTGGPLGLPSCKLATEVWFERADTNHDGRLDREEFMADARAQFLRMDLDGQGYLTSDVLERYRDPYRQRGRTAQSSGIDPVMSADRNFRGKVTREDFLGQATETFARLDADHDGALAKAELEPLCANALQRVPDHQPPSQSGAPNGGGGKRRHGGGWAG